MVKVLKKLIFYVLIIFIISSCAEESNPIQPIRGEGFAIYFLKDETLKIKNIINKSYDSLEFQAEPWISEKDIDFYDYSSHCIYLKKDKSYYVPDYAFLYDFSFSLSDKPFIVTANKRICYLGYFNSMTYGNQWYTAADITGFDIGIYAKDVLHIEWAFVFSNDARENADVREVLTNSNLYHGGLEIRINSIKVYPADTSTVEYTFSIINNDKDNLYFFDPDKVSTELFHCYTHGVMLLNTTNNKVYMSKYKKAIAPDPFY